MPNVFRYFGKGISNDFISRLTYYQEDWKGALKGNQFRVLAAACYIFFASAMPALAFGQQIFAETTGMFNVVHVLAATAINGVLQAILGGQPLLIVGVAEPIILVYGYMFSFAKTQPGLLHGKLFLPWAAWCCVWTSFFILTLSAFNLCGYINKFTRYSGELFGMLIAILFFQQAVKGLIQEFHSGNETFERQVNGLWSLILAFGFLLTSLLLRTAHSWRFLRASARLVLADYGFFLMVLTWTGLSFAVSSPSSHVPSRVQTPNTWDIQTSWTVAKSMNTISGPYIAVSIIPAIIITILFFFDHNISSKMAQQEDFNLMKPSAYHYDFMLLGFMTALCGLIGIPPVNGVLPQAPMHTKALSKRAGITQDSGLDVVEQRVSGLLQSLCVGACLGITPAIRQIPTAVLWGYFAFMAIESLPGSQFWERILLLITDPKQRVIMMEKGNAVYLQNVPFGVIKAFTILQLFVLMAVYGLTWAPIGGIVFPIPIMLLVPFRQWVMPTIFSREHLRYLDPLFDETLSLVPQYQTEEASEKEFAADDSQRHLSEFSLAKQVSECAGQHNMNVIVPLFSDDSVELKEGI